MIDWSSAPSTIVGSVVTIWPAVELTTRSMRMVRRDQDQGEEHPGQDEQRDPRLNRLRAGEDLGRLRLEDPDLAIRLRAMPCLQDGKK